MTYMTNNSYIAEKAGKNPQLWADVKMFLKSAGASQNAANQARQYVEKIPIYESEFAEQSAADKNIKQKEPGKGKYSCVEGHWRTIDDRHVFICD